MLFLCCWIGLLYSGCGYCVFVCRFLGLAFGVAWLGFVVGFWWFGCSLLLNDIWCLLVFEWLFFSLGWRWWLWFWMYYLWVGGAGLVWWFVGGGLCGLVCSMWLVNSVDLFKFFLNLIIWCGVVFLDSYNVVAFGLNVLIVVFVDSWFVGADLF